jgi:hypothetical protein
MEIIRLVEQSTLPLKRTLAEFGPIKHDCQDHKHDDANPSGL